MRSGVTLVELVVVGLLVAAVGVVSAPLFQAVVRDVPTIKRAIDAHVCLRDVLRQVRQDVEASHGPVETAPAKAPNGHLLSISDGAGLVRYRLADGQVIRERIGPDGRRIGSARSWPAPHAVVSCRLLERRGKAVAVAVTTAVEVSQDGRRFRKLANTQVFFIGSCRREGARP